LGISDDAERSERFSINDPGGRLFEMLFVLYFQFRDAVIPSETDCVVIAG